MAREDRDSVIELTRELVRIPSRASMDPFDLVLGRMSSWLAGQGMRTGKNDKDLEENRNETGRRDWAGGLTSRQCEDAKGPAPFVTQAKMGRGLAILIAEPLLLLTGRTGI
jgi:hypothetical protein